MGSDRLFAREGVDASPARTSPGKATPSPTEEARDRLHRLIVGTVVIALAISTLTNCALFHHFNPPAKDWQARTGQLLYRSGEMKVAGDVLVRFSKTGDFELTFSKGPGVSLFTIEQDATFAKVKSSLAGLSWSGPTDQAPQQLRGWLSLREKLISAPEQKVVRHTVGAETFIFRF
ncbi:MAG TPA: hypothetical protein VGM62_07340 [Chthoniobacterales bacterium]